MKLLFKHSYRVLLLPILIFMLVFSVWPSNIVYSKPKQNSTMGKSLTPNTLPIETLANSNNLKLNMRSVKIVKGKSARITVMHLPSKYKVSYSTSNKNIATVSNTGSVHGKKNGSATIYVTVKYNNRAIRKMTCSVVVGPAAVSVVIPKSKLTVTMGKKASINYIIKASNTVETPKFSSSNKKIATVSNTGRITPRAVGQVTITAKISNGKYDTCKVTVTKPPKNNKK